MFDEARNSEILALIRKKKAKRVLIQAPEGLKTGVQELADFLELNGCETIISIEPCFGACDLRDHEAKRLDCDLLLHLGHADFGLKTDVAVVYYEYGIEYDFIPLLKATAKKIKFRKICLVSTIQFRESIKQAKRFLESKGFVVYDGGHVLGCNVAAAKKFEGGIECYLFIGSGRFHPLGLQEKTSKPVLFLDIEKRSLEDLSHAKDKMEIKRGLRIEKAKGAANFGIMVSAKSGQLRIDEALEIKKKLNAAGRKAYILAGDVFSPEKIMGLKIDVLINTACPRIRDDAELFGKVILNAEDVDELLEKQ
jgi:2-(3-amino-3-carboxypropyl)histidine synthase